MSKPWANEPTRMCETDWNKKMKSMPLNDARNLERRMRAAERLLDWLVREADTPSQLQRVLGLSEAKKHLEAARKDDEQ